MGKEKIDNSCRKTTNIVPEVQGDQRYTPLLSHNIRGRRREKQHDDTEHPVVVVVVF